jgi:Tfp pilus assembly protein PilF
MFVTGRIATSDGTAVPNDALIERVCNEKVRQQVYASTSGDFTMQMGSNSPSYLDARGDPTAQDTAGNNSSRMGISRHALANCELRASASGFRPSVLNLAGQTTFGSNINVGAIVVQRATKIVGTTLNASPYNAPKDARKAYEKGLEEEKNGKLDKAAKYFEQAVRVYPKYVSAWNQLGSVLQKEKQNEAARAAYFKAIAIDSKMLAPYLSLAEMACEAENWPEALRFSGHILELDPMANVSYSILDLDPLNIAEAYFYNALANYKLNRMEAAEKSGLKAELVDLRTHFPQLHLLLADIFSRKGNYANAISEIQIYLELTPHAQGAEQVREELARLEKLNGGMPVSEKSEKN